MAIVVMTTDPQGLLKSIKNEINNNKVRTWRYDDEGDLTYLPDQWDGLAWFRPFIAPGMLIFAILPYQGKTVSRLAYAIYHGRFLEMLLSHFDLNFTIANVSALPDASVGDLVKGI
ncbi:hypothetical protein [Myxococcus fulvus]|uniref:hypothetical protein n=1 Tax=Myxococcus fulvus TaxID=33 RepID=UPI0020BFCD84|nr:hypothetical protein [Myxococcus fulvus]MCK8503020.1 hypothetical protein [Myxococcus fulvus]